MYFSGKLIESTTYKDSIKAGEYVPQCNLGRFPNPNDEWSLIELLQIVLKTFDILVGTALHNSVSSKQLC